MTHIRRLLDITACTSAFNGSPKPKAAKDQNLDLGGDVSMCPPPRLGQFYDFFSFSHLTPPFQCQSNLHSFPFNLVHSCMVDFSLVEHYLYCNFISLILVYWQIYEDQTVHSSRIRQRMISFRLM